MFLIFRDDSHKVIVAWKWMERLFHVFQKKVLFYCKHNQHEARIFRVRTSVSLFDQTPFSIIWQIFVYHVQDISLLQMSKDIQMITLLIWVKQIQKKIKDIFYISSIFPEDICLTNMSIFDKICINISVAPIIYWGFHGTCGKEEK